MEGKRQPTGEPGWSEGPGPSTQGFWEDKALETGSQEALSQRTLGPNLLWWPDRD